MSSVMFTSQDIFGSGKEYNHFHVSDDTSFLPNSCVLSFFIDLDLTLSINRINKKMDPFYNYKSNTLTIETNIVSQSLICPLSVMKSSRANWDAVHVHKWCSHYFIFQLG